MSPLSFEWKWTIDYFIFFGLLYSALSFVGAGMIFVIGKTVLQMLGIIKIESSHDEGHH